ncbi:MAG: hypothetical protein HKP61_11980 [Dactylosporangium sp.]|nr:hypothetical protein [Dactylosporangium sp.]NNJ61643.1 hypothetical protein [Dactylosporangium sp.]
MDEATRTAPQSEPEPEQPTRPDWKDTLVAATDIAIIGFGVVAASLLVVTLGGALAAGSFAAHQWIRHRQLPGFGEVWRLFLRWILPGALATGAVAGATTVLVIDIGAVRGGTVPGGSILLAATWFVVAGMAATIVLALVHLGRQPAEGWWRAARWAARTTAVAPHRAALPLGTAALASLLGLMVPVTFPVLVGFGLFAVHVVADRLLPETPGLPAS